VGWGRELAYKGAGLVRGASSHFCLLFLFRLDVAADPDLSFFCCHCCCVGAWRTEGLGWRYCLGQHTVSTPERTYHLIFRFLTRDTIDT